MTGSESGATSEDGARIERLERRLARERDAREQAERIAERGMRELWQTNRTLEARVAERTVELEASLAAVTMAAQAKERFLAELGHELTTPLHAVLGLLELVDASVLEPTDQGRMDEVRDHAVTLSELLRGLVELAGVEGAPAPSEIEIRHASAWLDELIEQWTRTAATRGQLLVPSVSAGDREVALDWRRLTRIAASLLDNVVQHADGGAVHVSVIATDDTVELTVADSGPGMSADQAAAATEPFVRHGAGAGVGIGLTMAQRLAVGAGGTLTLVSEAHGTSITVVLPIAH